MAKEDKKSNWKNKDGVSMQEIEGFAKKYAYESLSALAIIVATISSMFDFFSGPRWSLLFAAAAAVITLFFPRKLRESWEKIYQFLGKQENTTLIIIGIVRLVVALFLPFLIFAAMGSLAGISFFDISRHTASKMSGPKDSSSEDKEHF